MRADDRVAKMWADAHAKYSEGVYTCDCPDSEMIAAAIREAEDAMKERCAKLADAAAERNWRGDGSAAAPEDIAAAIRALGD